MQVDSVTRDKSSVLQPFVLTPVLVSPGQGESQSWMERILTLTETSEYLIFYKSFLSKWLCYAYVLRTSCYHWQNLLLLVVSPIYDTKNQGREEASVEAVDIFHLWWTDLTFSDIRSVSGDQLGWECVTRPGLWGITGDYRGLEPLSTRRITGHVLLWSKRGAQGETSYM